MKGWIFALVAVLASGCVHFERAALTGPVKRVDNVYANPYYDHSRLGNVLLLPLDNPYGDPQVADHNGDLTMAVLRSFGKFGYFNLEHDPHLSLSPIVDLATGSADRIQLGELRHDYHAEGVLKVAVEEFRPFDPMRIHVKAVILDTATGERVWAFDEVFDSDDAETVNLMRTFWNTRQAGGYRESRFEVERLRPGFFSHFVFYTMAHSYGRVRTENVLTVERILQREEAEKN